MCSGRAGSRDDRAVPGRLQDAFAALFSQVLLVAAKAGLARFGTVAIDGTKIAANASIDANRGQEWLDVQVDVVAEADSLDAAEDGGREGGAPVTAPGQLRDRTRRAERIAAAAEVTGNCSGGTGRRQRRGRRCAAAVLKAGDRWSGGSPKGHTGWRRPGAPGARDRAHQAKLDRHAALIAAGKRPMGRPPVPMEHSTRV